MPGARGRGEGARRHYAHPGRSMLRANVSVRPQDHGRFARWRAVFCPDVPRRMQDSRDTRGAMRRPAVPGRAHDSGAARSAVLRRQVSMGLQYRHGIRRAVLGAGHRPDGLQGARARGHRSAVACHDTR